MTDQNTARIADEAGRTFIQTERHEDIPVEGVIIVDLTASRQETRDKFIADFTKGSEQFEDIIGRVSTMGNVGLTLIVHNGDGVREIGRYDSPKELAEALGKVPCVSSGTQIGKSLDIVPKNAHFIVVNGDTTDGDTRDTLVQKAREIGIPVIPLLEVTQGGSGTTDEHREVLRHMGEASGVKGGPFSYDTRMSLLDFVAVASAAARGPEAVRSLKATGEIPEEVWNALPEDSIKSISTSARPKVDETIAARIEQDVGDGVNIGQVGKSVAGDASIVQRAGRGVNIGQIGEGAHVVIRIGEKDIEVSSPPLQITGPMTGRTVDAPVVDQTIPSSALSGPFSRSNRVKAGLIGLGALAATTLAAFGGGYFGAGANRTEIHGEDSHLLLQRASENSILFDRGSSELTPTGIATLKDIAAAIKSDPEHKQISCVSIIGHASRLGGEIENDALASRRAQAVRDYLQYGMGVPGNILQIENFGEFDLQGGPDDFDQRVKVEECNLAVG
jgi:outer membrane protein OmpA-like peptidoglycan-associated protein